MNAYTLLVAIALLLSVGALMLATGMGWITIPTK